MTRHLLQEVVTKKGITHKALGKDKSTLTGIREKKLSQKIEKHAGMAEQLMRDVAIEEALKIKIKATLEHKNKSFIKQL